MYEQFFGLTSVPFSKSITSRDMFKSASFLELQKRFDYMKNSRGIMVVYGESGSGKSSAIRYFFDSLDKSLFFPIYLPLSTITSTDFYRQLNHSLKGGPSIFKSRIFDSIQAQILDFAANKGIIPVIVFDEAHFFPDDIIKELQLVSNFKCDSVDPALFILAGHDSLQDKLLKSQAHSFYQRISMKYRLEALTKDETQQYILHHLKLCHCDEQIFSDGAIESIYKFSKGTMRIIGNIVTKVLLLAALEKKRKINSEDISRAYQEVI
jgi:type II secretory pathway predicted ATPase ExeA